MANLKEDIAIAKTIHGDKYDYSLIDEATYTMRKQKVPIRCPEHGVFYKSFQKHINMKQGCPECSGRKRYTNEEFIDKARKKVDCSNFTFEKTKYKTNHAKVVITCHCKEENGQEHGDFEITPGHLLSGQGCPKCRYIKSASSKRRTIEEVVAIANETHNNKYDYSQITEYKNDRIKYPIICPEHGIFYQTFNNHIKGKQGCPKCGIRKCAETRTIPFEEYVQRAKAAHNNEYEYLPDSYTSQSGKVTIVCKKHGPFEMDAANHLFLGYRCPSCSFAHSRGEDELYNFICELIGSENVKQRERRILKGDEIDIYVPSCNFGIEYNGLYWHSDARKEFDFHLKKTVRCEERGIRLFHIFEDEWKNKPEIVKSMICSILAKVETHIYARNCIIKEVSASDATAFLNSNHLQGACGSSVKLGLYFNDELVSLMTFGKSRHFVGSGKFEWELLRFCNKLNTNVIGGASRLLKHFIEDYEPSSLVSYADRRWSNGNLYEKLGFELYNKSKPNYYYIYKGKRVYRFNFRKQVLIEKFGCPPEMSEREFCKSQGWFRIYDCGCLCYKMEFK
jgi:hypothetical protein